jgi:ribosome-associated protein YbcJ (S4-like RNA binding protein)
MEQNVPDGSLRAYERHVAVILISILIAFSVFVSYEKTSEGRLDNEDPICAHVVGAVFECKILVPRGTTVEDVLKKVTFEKTADFSEIDSSRRMMRDEILVIPYVGKVTLFVTGAVEFPKIVVLNIGSGPKDVLAEIQVRDDADIKTFLRRKKLLSGSVVEIRTKKAKKVREVRPKKVKGASG